MPSPSPHPNMSGLNLVVGHDGHPSAAAALDVAIDLASRLDAHLHVVHCADGDDFGIDPDTESYEATYAANRESERRTVTLELEATGISWTLHQLRGDPATQLTRLANELDALFIVVGAPSHRLLDRILASDHTTTRLLHHPDRPVMVVPGTNHVTSATVNFEGSAG